LKPVWIAAILALCAMPAAWGADWRSTGRAAILYDAPSANATRIAIAGPDLPLEVFVETADWLKVRTHTGQLLWIERAALGDKQTVMVNVDEALVRQSPGANAAIACKVVRGVLLDEAGETRSGWVKVRHPTCPAGWLQRYEVWGQ
jgi:SH3-like domain-containing protein